MDIKFQILPHIQNADRPFPVTVYVKNARPGGSLQIQLQQMVGAVPLWGPESQPATVGTDGLASHTFTVRLKGVVGAGVEAFLLASATDAEGGAFDSDCESARVV